MIQNSIQDCFIQIGDSFCFITLLSLSEIKEIITNDSSNVELLGHNIIAFRNIPGYGDFYSPFNNTYFAEYPLLIQNKMENCDTVIIPDPALKELDLSLINRYICK